MSTFKIIYRIMRYLEEHLGDTEFDEDAISHERFGISRLRWEAILQMMQEEGYIRGLVYRQSLSDAVPRLSDPIMPRITIKGLEYLEENSLMKKAGEAVKAVKEFIP